MDRPVDRGRRIVLVDDQPDALESMCALLRIWGHEVQAASNGEDAIALVLLHRPDVVILDLKMPGMSGRELAHAAGFDAFLVKPAKLDELRTLLDDAPTIDARR